MSDPFIEDNALAKPWYKEFWAWFIFTPLIVVVIACSFMVTLAFKVKQDVVYDDYYDVGRTIDQVFEPQMQARALNIKLVVYFDNVTGEVFVDSDSENSLADQPTSLLRLFLSHPADAEKDHIIPLTQLSASRWRADIKTSLSGRWYVRVSAFSSEEVEQWRVQNEVDIDTSTMTVELTAQQ